MLGSSVLEVAIGLSVIFLVFSLVTSGIYEAGAKAFAWRSKSLWAAIRALLDEDASTTAPRPLRGRLRDAAPEGDVRPTQAPPADDASNLSMQVYLHPLVGALDRPMGTKTRIDQIDPTNFARALIDTLVPDSDGTTSVEQWRTSIAQNPSIPAPLKRQLLLLVREASGDLDRLRTKIAGWFDTQMDLLTQTYRKRARWFMVGIGLVVAVVCNVDAVAAAERLYRDDTLRAALVAESEEITGTCTGKKDEELSSCLEGAGDDVAIAVRLPVGWDDPDLNAMSGLGWVATGAALSMGASFWFDMLKRITGLRER